MKKLWDTLVDLNEKLGSGLSGAVLAETIAALVAAWTIARLGDLSMAAGEAAGWLLKLSTNPYVQVPLIGLSSLSVGLRVGRNERVTSNAVTMLDLD